MPAAQRALRRGDRGNPGKLTEGSAAWFWFILASLWGCPVAEAKVRCTYREFREWQVFYSLYPWGEERQDLRFGIVASMLAQRWGSRSAKPSDFVLRPAGELRRQSAGQMESVLRTFAAVHNARVAAAAAGN